ncbi:MAG: prepilin-type N-terminal cleavage/methylation domain-containing protein [Nitrospirota bacterium]
MNSFTNITGISKYFMKRIISNPPLPPFKKEGQEVSSANHVNAGFTLIEILISIAILSTILAAVYGTFFLSHRAIEGLEESIVKMQEARKAIDILKCEIESVYYNENHDSLLRIEDRDFHGKPSTQLTFTAFSVLRPGLSKLFYYVEEKDGKLNLYKKIESLYREEKSEGVDIIEDLEAFTIEAQYDDKWIRTWDTEINKAIPGEIKINLTLKMKGRTVTLFDVAKPMLGRSI